MKAQMQRGEQHHSPQVGHLEPVFQADHGSRAGLIGRHADTRGDDSAASVTAAMPMPRVGATSAAATPPIYSA